MTSPGCRQRCPFVFDSYFSMHTTVVDGWPMEHVADSEFVPTPDESLMISLVSPRLLSIIFFCFHLKSLSDWGTKKRQDFLIKFILDFFFFFRADDDDDDVRKAQEFPPSDVSWRLIYHHQKLFGGRKLSGEQQKEIVCIFFSLRIL